MHCLLRTVPSHDLVLAQVYYFFRGESDARHTGVAEARILEEQSTARGVGIGLDIISRGKLTIDGDGRIIVNDSEVGQLGLVEVDDPHVLRRMGYTLYGVPEGVDPIAATETSMMSGALEASNVQVPSEVMKMMMALRAYSANQQVISSVSETVSRLIDQVGAPS